jgi:glutaredoxin-like protein
MALLKPADAEAVRRRLQQDLAGEVEVTLVTASAGGLTIPGVECESCPAAEQLLREVAALDPRIRLRVRGVIGSPGAPAVERIPAILIAQDGRREDPGVAARGALDDGGARIRYYGIPAGFEFAAFLEDLVAVSRGDSGLSPQTRQALAGLTRDVHIQVFVTPTCPYCPRAARLAHAMALESVRVRADVIDASEYPGLARRYNVYGVPKVVINETTAFEGALPETAFLAAVLEAAA